MSIIYLDHAATTPVLPEVAEAMLPYYKERYANPSGIYEFARHRKKEIENVREIIAGSLGAKPDEIYFTSGGSESDNWALKATAAIRKQKRCHIITTKIEHHAILHSCSALEKQGIKITWLNVDERGRISLEELEKSIGPDTALISVMFANNEVGTIQPIKKIGYLAKKHNVLFHTDAVQAYAHLPIHVKEMGIDMLSASAHKFNGPKGVGFLYVREGILLPSYIHGGGQEAGRRAGTENVAGIIGMGKAVELSLKNQKEQEKKIRQMRDHMIERLLKEVPYSRLNGDRTNRLSGNCNISFQFIEGSSLLILLDTQGICASAGSACSTGSSSPSHVLKAMGIPDAIAHGTVRFTLGPQNTMEEIDHAVDCVKAGIKKLRETSAEYEDLLAYSRKKEIHKKYGSDNLKKSIKK